MPTFMFFKKGVKVDEMKGADAHHLEFKIKQHVASISATSGGSGSKEYVKGMTNLNDKIDLKQLEIANAVDASAVRNLFDPASRSVVKSDSDEQLMIYIPFQESLRVHSLVFRVDKDSMEHAPVEFELYANRPTILSFDDVGSVPSTQSISNNEVRYNDEGEALVNLRFVKFQRCNSLVIFVQQNQGEDEVTSLRGIEIIGEVGAANSSGVVQKIDHDHA